MARERPRAPIIGMTPRRETGRRLALVWGVSPVVCDDVADVDDMTQRAIATARKLESDSEPNGMRGMPFGFFRTRHEICQSYCLTLAIEQSNPAQIRWYTKCKEVKIFACPITIGDMELGTVRASTP